MKILQNLEPKDVFGYFEEISNIPRGSGNEKAISDYLVNFGKGWGLESIHDEVLNVMINCCFSLLYTEGSKSLRMSIRSIRFFFFFHWFFITNLYYHLNKFG